MRVVIAVVLLLVVAFLAVQLFSTPQQPKQEAEEKPSYIEVAKDVLINPGEVKRFSFELEKVPEKVRVELSLITEGGGDRSLPLLVKVNGTLPESGDFGITPAIDQFLKQVEESSPEMAALLRKSVILVPEPIGIGNGGVRNLYFTNVSTSNTIELQNLDLDNNIENRNAVRVIYIRVYGG